jgi:hypothetical protein
MAQAEHVIIAIGALTIGVGTKPSTSLVRAAHAEFVLPMAGHEPHPTPIDREASDLENRAEHMTKVLARLSIYVRAILDDAAQNVGGLDPGHIAAVLADLASDLTGTIRQAADDMAPRLA